MKGELKTFRTNSQNFKILNYLKTGDNLTVAKARALGFGDNLRSRISDLKKAGYDINSKQVNIKGGYIAKYTLSVDTLKRLIEQKADLEFNQIEYIYYSDEEKYRLDKDMVSKRYLGTVLMDLENHYTALPF